jgi:hypothetical protein
MRHDEPPAGFFEGRRSRLFGRSVDGRILARLASVGKRPASPGARGEPGPVETQIDLAAGETILWSSLLDFPYTKKQSRSASSLKA